MLICFIIIVELIVSQLKIMIHEHVKVYNFAQLLSICRQHLLELLAQFSWTKENLKFIVSNSANVVFISVKS